MPDPTQDLRSTEDAISADAKSIAELEREKADLDPKDPRVRALSARVKQTAVDANTKASAEQELAEQIQKG